MLSLIVSNQHLSFLFFSTFAVTLLCLNSPVLKTLPSSCNRPFLPLLLQRQQKNPLDLKVAFAYPVLKPLPRLPVAIDLKPLENLKVA